MLQKLLVWAYSVNCIEQSGINGNSRFIYIYVCVCVYVYVYIYIYIKIKQLN